MLNYNYNKKIASIRACVEDAIREYHEVVQSCREYIAEDEYYSSHSDDAELLLYQDRDRADAEAVDDVAAAMTRDLELRDRIADFLRFFGYESAAALYAASLLRGGADDEARLDAELNARGYRAWYW